MRPRHSSDGCSPELAAVVCWTAGLGAVTAEGLANECDCSLPSARGRLLAATRAGLLLRSRPLTGQPSLYTSTRRGLLVAGMEGSSPSRVSPAGVRHMVLCCHAATVLARVYADHRVLGEPEFRRRERRHGRLLYSVPIRAGMGSAGIGLTKPIHRPDLVLIGGSHDGCLPIAVEIELTVKAPQRLTAICRAWARCRYLAGVLYLTSPEVEAPLRRAIAGAQAGERIVQVGLDALERPSAQAGSLEGAIPGRT